MEMGSRGRRVKLTRGAIGGVVNQTGAAHRESTVHSDLVSSHSKVRSQQIPDELELIGTCNLRVLADTVLRRGLKFCTTVLQKQARDNR